MRHRWLILPGAVMVALALVFTACGGDDDDDAGDDGGAATATKEAGGDSTATEKPEATAEPTEDSGDRLAGPCSLVTPAEITAIAGEEYGEGELNRDDCTYNSPTSRTVSVTLEDHSGQAGSSFQDTLDIFDATEIDGVGERALWIDQFGELNVLIDDDRILIVSVPFILADDKEGVAIEIAQKALD